MINAAAKITRVAALSVALILLLATVVLTPGRADAASDARNQRDQVRKQKAAIASQINVLKATDAEIQAALKTLNQNVAGAEAVFNDARAASDAASAEAAAAKAKAEATAADLGDRREKLKVIAVESYMRSPVSNSELENVTLTDANDAVRAQVFAQVWGERADDLADQVEVLAADQAAYQAQAESAAATAEAREAEVQARVEELRVARAQQRKLAAQVEDKLERALSESASLAQLDKTLSDQIARESQRYRAPRGGGGGGGSLPQAGNVSVRTVGGITVATSIADNVERLLAAASADGISFGGGGYRNSSSQIALRRSNCGSSNYAIYQMPASQCSPPTARPGASMHERGLAIDFTYNGRVINSRSNPGYLWLKANASKYGLYNLPSEPWHWSVNGN
jgi:hypothetical protein